jgi:hypothetical protein
MSTANDAKSKEATSLVVEMLSTVKRNVNWRNNYSEWAPGIQTMMGIQYVAIARVLLDRVPYVVPELGPEDLPQLDDPGMEGLTAANKASIRVSAITARAKKVRELRDACSKCFNSILSKVSVASQLRIEAGGEWAEAKVADNPNALVEIIHRTHFTYVDGATPATAKVILFKVLPKLEQGTSQEMNLF